MAFLEQILPNTLGPKHYSVRNLFFLNPFADRDCIALAMSLDNEYRFSDQANTDLLRLAHPELAGVGAR